MHKQKRTVAFVTQPLDSFLPPVQTSLGLWAYTMARHLSPEYEVTVYARKMPNVARSPNPTPFQIQFIPCLHYRIWLQLLILYPKLFNRRTPVFASDIFCLDYALQVAKDLRRRRCDVVHVINFLQFVPLIRRFNPETKIVLHMQCEWLSQLDSKLVAPKLADADLIIGCSEYITGKIRESHPQRARHCATLYNAVDTDHFVPAANKTVQDGNRPKRLLFVGRVSPEKGLHVLLDAFARTVQSLPDTELTIVGHQRPAPPDFIVSISRDPKVLATAHLFRGSYLQELTGRLDPDVLGRISFTGHIPNEKLVEYYQNADIFLFPSLWNEPFGIPVIEAMSCRVPVIAARSGGIPEIIVDGRSGLLVERGNAGALAAAITRLLSDDVLRQSMAESGRVRVEDLFTWKRTGEQLLDLYGQLENNFSRVA